MSIIKLELKGDELIVIESEMEFLGESKPIKVKIPHDRIEWTALLMPMRDKN